MLAVRMHLNGPPLRLKARARILGLGWGGGGAFGTASVSGFVGIGVVAMFSSAFSSFSCSVDISFSS